VKERGGEKKLLRTHQTPSTPCATPNGKPCRDDSRKIAQKQIGGQRRSDAP